MTKAKLWTLSLALAAIALLDIVAYRNIHLYFQSQKTDDPQKKITILGGATSLFPWNDLVFYELGKAYFDLGAGNLTEKEFSHKAFQNSRVSFKRSLALNPGSYFGHFNLARTLDYLGFWDPGAGKEAFEEFRKAALLAGQNSQIYFEVGKVLFSSWPQLANDNREFVTEILKKVGARKNLNEIQELLEIWEMNVKDYAVIEKILPEESAAFRAYAKFLGEKSLSLAERQKYMTLAETLEFWRADNEFRLGEESLFHFEIKDARERFQSCLDILSQFRFYQDLTGQSLVNPSDFRRLRKLTYLDLAKCQIEDKGELKDAIGYLRNYLLLEDEVTSVSELESYLRKRGLLAESMESSAQDLDRLALEVYLRYKQNKYGEIIKISSLLEQSFVVIPPEKKDEYLGILQIIGDSYQKAGYFYEADRLYQKSLEIDPLNLQTLVRIRSVYERLNENEKLREVNAKIEQVLSPREILSTPTVFQKGEVKGSVLILDGRKISLEVSFQDLNEGEKPLVSLHFNGRVVWEDYAGSPSITVVLDSEPGQNPFHFVSINRPVSLLKIAYKNMPS